MAPSPPPAPPSAEDEAYVRVALGEVRLANAVAIARLRVAVRALMVGLSVLALLGRLSSQTIDPRTSLLLSGGHLLLGLVVLWWLRRRPSESAIVAATATDVVSIAAGAWLAVGRPSGNGPLAVMLFGCVMQLLLLWGALTLRRAAVGWLAAGTVAFMAVLAWRAGIGGLEALALLAVLSVFGLSAAAAGTRIVALAVRASLEARAGELSRRSAQELRAAKEALEAAQAQAEATTALIVHDLRNPLASVLAQLEEIREALGTPSPAVSEALDVASDEVHRLAGMAGDLLLVSRLEDGLEPERREVALEPFLVEVARSLGPVVAQRGAALSTRADGVGAASIDPALVRRLLENLLVNASRHVGPGDRVELSAERREGLVRLSVRNTGPPVPPGARAHLFDRGFSEGRREWHHAGLGLHLCALVAERHGGVIGLVDRPGWAVSFEVELPLRPGGGR